VPLISLIFIDLSFAKDLAKGEIKNLSDEEVFSSIVI